MLKEITDAIVRSLDKHGDVAISGALGIAGTILGVVLAFVIDWLREKGKVTVTKLRERFIFIGDEHYVEHSFDPAQVPHAIQINHGFELRFLNTFPIPKSLSVEQVDFLEDNRKTIVVSDVEPHMGFQWDATDRFDLQLDAHTFIRVFVRGVAMTKDDKGGWLILPPEVIQKIRWVRIKFTVSPKTPLELCFLMPPPPPEHLRNYHAL